MFKVGDEVELASSNSGSTTRKICRVEAVIPARGRPSDAQRKEADAYGLPRDHESYLVRVPGKTSESKGKLYWPRVAALEASSSAS
jgi:hypothetical protein